MTCIDNIYNRILSMPLNSAFVVSDFMELGDHEAIKKSLTRLEKKGKIRRVLRGVYDNPAYSNILQEYSEPSPEKIAEALARSYNWDIAPCGDTALNMLGLSTQVTARQTYISSGPYREYHIGNITLEFKHTALKEIAGMSKMTAFVIQALKTLGKDNIDSSVIKRIRRRLSDNDKVMLLEEGKQAPIWMYSYIKKISVGENYV